MLMPKANDVFRVTDEEAEKARAALLSGNMDAPVVDTLRKKVTEKKKAVQVLAEDSKVNSSARIANALSTIDEALLDGEVIEAVRSGIVNSPDPAKSYLEFSKAATELQKRLDSQIDSTFTTDGLLHSGKKAAKIQLAFGNGNLALAIDTGDGE